MPTKPTANSQLGPIIAKLEAARYPEDVFGELTGVSLKAVYRQLSKALHPDVNPDDPVAATAAFAQLTMWYNLAQSKVDNGTYGDRGAVSGVKITSRSGTYAVEATLARGDLSEVYLARGPSGAPVVLKALRSPANADLATNERNVLKFMHETWDGKTLDIMCHVPRILDSFRIKEGSVHRPTIVMPYVDGVTLEDVEQRYSFTLKYIDPRDLAWMINRMLGALLAAHQAGYVHCGVLPPHIYLHPKDHGGQLLDWSYAVKPGQMVKAIAPRWRAFYPPELINPDKAKRLPADFGTDLYMLAKCVWFVTDAGARLPRPYAGLFRACLLGPKHRPTNVFEFFKEFQDVLSGLYGPKKFRVFELPNKP